MKTDRKIKPEKSPPKTKAVKPNGRAVPKTNGKHPLAAYEHIPVGIVEASLDGKYMDVNEEFCRILGYSRKELLRRGIKDCTHEDDYAVDYTLYEQLVVGKIPFYRLEKRYVRKDGSSIWVELTRSLVRDAKGKPLHTVGVVLDISDRKDVEKVLRDSVERLRLATGAAQMFMWEWDFETQSYIIADNYEQVLGFSAGLLPKNKFETIWALSLPEDVQLISDGFQKAVENQSDLRALPCRIINPENREIVWLEISAKIVYDRDGKPERMFGVAQNITENKNTQDQIAIISRMPEENPNPVMRLTPDGHIMYANPVSTAVLEDWVQGDIPEELHNKITHAFHSGVKTEVEIRNRERIFSFTLAPIVEGGYVNLYGRNITERKQMEQALRESEERYRRIVETANEGIWEIDRDTCTTFVNPRMAQMLGYTAEEMAGRSSFDFVFPEDNDEGKRRLVRAKSGTAKSDEFRFRRKDGSPLWALVSTSPQLDEDGNFLGSIAMVADITERKQLENTLRESEERFRAMVSQTTAGIAESNLDSQLVFVNPGFCEILGYSEAELLGKTIWELTYTQDLEENKRLFKRMLEEGESYQFEKRFIRKDGSLLWTSVSVTTIYDLAGKPKGGVGVILDIETRKQAESALAEYARQQESLYHLSDQLLRTESLVDVFNAALDAILNALQCDRASILLFDHTDVMRFVAWRGLSDAYRKATDGHSPWKRDAKDPQPISMGDVRTADLDESLRSIILDEGIGSLAFIPLVVNGTLIGKFMIYFNVPHTFDDAELDFSTTIAHQLASGIDRKRAEEALRESEQKFTLIYENLPFAAALAKPETGVFVDVNQEFEKVFGYSKQDIIGKTSFELGINPQVEVREQVLKELQQHGSARNVEVELVTRAGEMRSFINNIDIVSINEEKYILSTLQEITERKQTEKRLVLMAEVSEMLRNFDDPYELMYRISVAVGQHLHVKRALFNEIDLEHDREIVHRDYHKDLESVAGVHKVSAYSSITSREVAAGKTVVNMDSKIDPRTAQDYEKTYAVSRERAYVAVPLMRDNRWVASFWVSDDVPRQWNSEEISLLETVAERTWAIVEKLRINTALRESEQRYRFIVENTSDGIWWVELTEPMPISLSEEEQIDWYYRHAVMRQCNLGLARMYGYKSIEDVVGLPIQILMPREIAENLELTRHFIRSGYRLVDAESREVSADGRELVFLNNMVGMIENDRLVGEWGTNRDITERKRAEEALRASESLYRAIARSIPGGGVYVVDKDFRYLVAEGPVTNAFGLSREMLEGHTVTEVFPDERGRRMEDRLRQNFAGESLDFETSHNGRVYWTQQAPLYDSIGQAIILTLDITERKRAEEALRQSEERFARFMQHLPGLAWIKDMEGRYIYANAAAQKAFRTPHEILYGRTDEEIFPEEVAAQFRENDRLALSDEKGVQVIETLEQDDGLLHYSLVSKFPISGRDGNTLIGGTAFDITERRQAEEALRESEERFRAILRQATAGIVRKDAQGRLLFVNEAFCNMLGYTELDLTGKTIWEFMHPDDVEENRRSYERLMQEGIPFKLERRFLRQDGTVIWVDASVSPIMDSTGKPQSAVAVEVDITGRKLAEEALQQLNAQLEDRVLNRTAKLRAVNQTLREEIAERQRVEQALRQSEAVARANEEKLSTLFELLPVGISFLDPEGQIIQVNPALENLMKLPKEQLSDQADRSRHYIRANGTTMHPAEFASQRALTEGKIVYNMETGIVLEDGEVIWTSVSAAPVNVAEVGAVVVTADITESKRAERALQESRERLQILSQRLVEVQEEERRAIARELHDRVGQTLAALNINLIIISGQLSGKVDEQISTRLNDSMKLVAETIALVRDVMSNLRPSVLDDYGLEAAIDSQLNQFTSRYEIGVKFEKPSPPIPRLGPSVEMTFLRIAQEALMNIARHAQATQVHLRLWQEDYTVCMTVQDNGTGISSWQDANRPGSHGLTIMRERAEAFGGNLKVSSVPGKGTKVEVKIPFETNDPSRIMEGRPE